MKVILKTSESYNISVSVKLLFVSFNDILIQNPDVNYLEKN